MRTSEPRRSQYVNRQIQGTLARQMVKHWLIFFGVGFAVTAMLQYLLDPFQSFSEVVYQLWHRQGSFVVVALLLLPVFVLDSIKLSHRVVGPLIRVQSALRSLTKGETVAPLTFRPHDFWHELAEEFNAAIPLLQKVRPEGLSNAADDACDDLIDRSAESTPVEPVASA